jgi:hypothetical protein
MMLYTKLSGAFTCGTCTCGHPQGATCAGGMAMFSPDPLCPAASSGGIPVPGCSAAPGTGDVNTTFPSIELRTPPTASGGMCMPSQGTLSGTPTPTDLMTSCCM